MLNNGAFDGKYFYVVSNEPPSRDDQHAARARSERRQGRLDAEDFDKITWGAPSLANGVLFVPIDTELYVFNAKTGDQLTMFETGGTIAAGAAAIADGNVVVGSGLQYPFGTVVNNNQIHCYGQGQVVGRRSAGAREWIIPRSIGRCAVAGWGRDGGCVRDGGRDSDRHGYGLRTPNPDPDRFRFRFRIRFRLRLRSDPNPIDSVAVTAPRPSAKSPRRASIAATLGLPMHEGMSSQVVDPVSHARSARAFVVVMGVVALFGDMTYEGARGLLGPYLALLGASAAAVGFAAGLGEFLGYALRLLTGWLGDRTRAYWPLVIAGYALNLVAVPGLALVGSWQAAVALLLLERIGKAVRSPARSTLVSYAANEAGVGKSFGLEEALDQIGAVSGPLLTAFVIWVVREQPVTARYRDRVSSCCCCRSCSTWAWCCSRGASTRDPKSFEPTQRSDHPHMGGLFRWYVAAAMLMALGFADWALVAFHATRTGSLERRHVAAALRRRDGHRCARRARVRHACSIASGCRCWR